jgi:MoxR-like ATPase
MPEGVQNVLLPALDEGLVHVPHLGTVRAVPGFAVIATQNPAEFVATGHLSEALLDRFELVRLGYQGQEEEEAIVLQEARCSPSPELVAEAVALVRATRDPRIRRGASVRAAVAIADIAATLGCEVARAAALALPTRIELADGKDLPFEAILAELDRAKKKILPIARSPRST